jgi:hypothetical protein
MKTPGELTKPGFEMKKLLHLFISFFILIYIFLEDITVNLVVKPIEKILNKFQFTIKISQFIKRQNKYVILILFLLPFVGMEFIGLYSLKQLAIKKYITGVFLYLFKFYLAIPTLFIFRLTKKTLTKFFIIRQFYFIILKLEHSSLYKKVIAYRNSIKQMLIIKLKEIKQSIISKIKLFLK